MFFAPGLLSETLTFGIKQPNYQELVRGAATGLAALAVAGNEDALRTLIDAGIPSRDPARVSWCGVGAGR